MRWADRVAERLPVITGNPERDRAIREELAQHCADRYRELIDEGGSETEAAARVLSEIEQTARRRRALVQAAAAGPGTTALAERAGRFADSLRRDLRLAAKRLAGAPVFAAAAVLTLAIAIGATTAVFSVVEGILLRPLPYPAPESLVHVWETSPTGYLRNVVSSGNYLDWRARQTSFTSIGALQRPVDVAWTGGAEPKRLSAVSYSVEAVETLDLAPAAGRRFALADGLPNAPLVAMIGHGFWTRQFGSDPSVVGRQVVLQGRPYEIVGVLPRDTVLPDPRVDVLLPLRLGPDAATSRRSHPYIVIGRLRPGVTIDAAQSEMRSIAAAIAHEHPGDMTGWSARVVPIHDDLVHDVRPLLMALAGLVAVVLLMACVNLANLQLARASQRAPALAVQAALGAGRRRLATEFIAESAWLAAAGGALGVGLVVGLRPFLIALLPADIPRLDAIGINGTVLALSLAATTASLLLVGLLPAWHASRADAGSLMHGARVRANVRQARVRLVLVAAQVGLAVVLLVSAGLLVRSAWRLSRVETGFDPARLLTVELNLPSSRYRDNAAHRLFYDDLLERIGRLPGVRAAAGTTLSAGAGTGMTFSYAIEGRPSNTASGRESPQPLQAVTAGYLETMGIAVRAGRGFSAQDHETSVPVVVINEGLARLHWAGESPLGARLSFRPGETPWLEVVGVVADTRDEGRAVDPPPTLYVPFSQRPSSWSWMSWQTLVIRTDGDPHVLVPAIRSAVHAIDASLPLLQVRTMHAALAETEAQRRFALELFAAFAIIALLLGAIGVYGVLAHGVAQRRQEIGIRLMLGARPMRILQSVMRTTMIAACVGVVAGLGAALLLTRLLTSSLLFETPATDAVTFAVTAIVLLIVAAAAAWLPARRALRLDPAAALRER